MVLSFNTTRQKKSCSYLKIIMTTQATIMAVFFVYFHWYHHSQITNGYYRPKGSSATQDLYMNGELSFNVSLSDKECVEEFLQQYLEYCNQALVPPQDILRTSNSDNELPLCLCIPHSSKFSQYAYYCCCFY